jgi:hypothetical protein
MTYMSIEETKSNDEIGNSFYELMMIRKIKLNTMLYFQIYYC